MGYTPGSDRNTPDVTSDARSDINQLQETLRQFAAARDWEQFHNPKNLILALVGEVGELAELFQWLTPEQSVGLITDACKREQVAHELADVFAYLLRLADVLGVDLAEALREKIAVNEKRYTVVRARGTSKKYTELQEDA